MYQQIRCHRHIATPATVHNLLCLIYLSPVTSAVLHLSAALKTPSDEHHIFDLVNMSTLYCDLEEEYKIHSQSTAVSYNYFKGVEFLVIPTGLKKGKKLNKFVLSSLVRQTTVKHLIF